MTIMIIRTYKELSDLKTFEERFEYLKLNGEVGASTFGFDRIFNQIFYRSKEWKSIRSQVIIRDNGCDLGAEEHDIYGKILVHHMNPISINDIEKRSDFLLNPDYLICTSHITHNAIHYGDSNLLPKAPAERYANDTCLWKRLSSTQSSQLL